MVLNPLPEVIKKKLSLFSSYECLLSKVTGNSDSQRPQKITVLRELRYEMVPYLLAKVYNGHNCYILILLEMD